MIRHNRTIISFATAMTMLVSTAYGVNLWSSQAQQPHKTTGGPQAGGQVSGKLACRVSEESIACLNYKIASLTERLNQLEQKQHVQQGDAQGKADDMMNIWKSINEIRKRLGMPT